MYLYVEYMMHVQAGGVVDIANDNENRSNNIALKKARTVTKHLGSFDGDDKIASVVIVTIHQAMDLPSCAAVNGVTLRGLSDPIVYLSIDDPVDENIVGEQSQRTSLVLTTLNPEWKPPEVFQFLLYDVDEERISLSVMSQCGVDKAHLGHCMIDASSLVLGEQITSIYPLQSIGDEAAGQIMISALRISIEEAKIRSCYECL